MFVGRRLTPRPPLPRFRSYVIDGSLAFKTRVLSPRPSAAPGVCPAPQSQAVVRPAPQSQRSCLFVGRRLTPRPLPVRALAAARRATSTPGCQHHASGCPSARCPTASWRSTSTSSGCCARARARQPVPSEALPRTRRATKGCGSFPGMSVEKHVYGSRFNECIFGARSRTRRATKWRPVLSSGNLFKIIMHKTGLCTRKSV